MSRKKITSLLQREVEDTFPKLLIRNYNKWGDKQVAIRKKEKGVWKEYTWKDCYDNVRSIFRGLLALTLAPGERVAIIGDSTPEWLWCELAVQAARGTVIAINPALPKETIKLILDHAKPKLVMAEDQEQIDRIFALYDQYPFNRLIYWKDKGLRHYQNPELISLKEIINEGIVELARVSETGHPAHFEQTLMLGNGSDPAIIIYSMNPSGQPEEIVSSHEFLIYSAETVLNLNPVDYKDEYVSIMNPCWFFEQALGFGATLISGQRLNFAENVETSMKDFREISPDTLAYPSHLWHRLATTMQTNLSNSSRIKRMLFSRLYPFSFKIARTEINGVQTNIIKQAIRWIIDLMTFRPLRDKHGLDHVRIAYSSGDDISEEDLLFFRAIGIEIKHLYASYDRGIVTIKPEANQLIQRLV